MTGSDPVVTSVRRDTVSSAVGATFKLSMLYPREENMFATRASAPASFCRSMEMICRMLVAPAPRSKAGHVGVVGELLQCTSFSSKLQALSGFQPVNGLRQLIMDTLTQP